VTGEAKVAYTTGTEPPGGFHAFHLDLREAVITAVEGNELVVRLWQPGHPVRVRPAPASRRLRRWEPPTA
jgi:hypothetical protein